MPVWARVGVSATGRTLLFAIAIVKDESVSSMEFIQQNFIISIEGNIPEIIIIDESPG